MKKMVNRAKLCTANLFIRRFSAAIQPQIRAFPSPTPECSNSVEISAYYEHGKNILPFGQWDSPAPYSNTYPATVRSLDACRDIDHGQVYIMQPKHNMAVQSESRSVPTCDADLKTLNWKIAEHMKIGLVDEAQQLFERMPKRNTVSWNSMICGYFKNGLFHDALHLYNNMPNRDLFSYNTVITGLMRKGDVDGAKEIFNYMPCKDIVTWNSMISGYVQNELMNEAMWMFNNMPSKNVVSWNLVIGGLLNSEELDLALKMFHEMGDKDIVSWTIMISAFVRLGRVVEARELFDAMPVRDAQAWNTIIAGYIHIGYVDSALVLFQKMPFRNLNAWREIITRLVSGLRISDAIRLFNEMPEKCQKIWNSILMGMTNNGFVEEAHSFVEKSLFDDLVSRTILINGYFGKSEIQSGINVFELMHTRDTTAWNATIFGFIANDLFEDGLRLFMRMKKLGFPIDEATITSALTICWNLQALNLGTQTHGQAIKVGLDHLSAVSNALVTMYARCGNVNFALFQFSSMPYQEVISWNSIISGFAHHGHGEKALKMFNKMRLTDVKPNHITFTALLSACSHGGLVQQGKLYFNLMRYKYLIQPMTEHYTCLIDLLGRFGLIDEAVKFVEQMREDGMEVPASVWGALLGACRMHKNMDVAEFAGEKALELEPQNSGFYMILAEIYLENGKRKDAERMWSRMKGNVVKKQPGCSWIEVNNTGHIFLSGSRSHPEFSSICCILHLMVRDVEIEAL